MSNTFFNNILWLSVVCLHINSSQVNAASRVQAFIIMFEWIDSGVDSNEW